MGKLVFVNYRGFSCDVISSQFCKSFYSRPPCWFPFAWTGIGKYNKMSCYFLFSSYHNTKLRLSDNNSKTHTWLKFQILLYSKSKVTAGFVVFLHTAPYKKETKERGKVMRVYVLQHRVNPLYSNAIAAAVILMGTYGGQVIVPTDCFGANSTNYHYCTLLHNNTNMCLK